MAHLRLVRGGGARFLADCVHTLAGIGVAPVLSPPLPPSAQKTWREADFERHADLVLMRRLLDRIDPPGHLVHTGGRDDLDEVLRIDGAAFDDFWRFDRRGLLEAMMATPRGVLHVVRRQGGGLAGYAVSGIGTTIAYLQRLAVDPGMQRLGIGRSLVRTAARWAKGEGARVMMLNSPTANAPAIRLYESEGFATLDEPLAVLRSK